MSIPTTRRAAVSSALRPLKPRREYVLNHLVSRIPWVEVRMAAYERLGVRFADRSTALIMLGSEVWEPTLLEVGTHASIGRSVLLDARGGIRLGNSVNVSSHVKFMTGKHLPDDPVFLASYDPITVGDHAWIALGSTVLGGVDVGAGAIVAAGSVVTRDVAPYTIVGGSPARFIRPRRSGPLDYEIDFRPDWL